MRTSTIQTFARNALLLLCSLLVSLFIGEVALRVITSDQPSTRFLFFSAAPYRLDSLGAVRYIPNATLRSVAVYDGSVEYDVQFYTNNLGFIDERDYPTVAGAAGRPAHRYAFVGDSFTAGIHGGSPWVPRLHRALQARQPPVALYNLGVEGAGFEQMYRVLASTHGQLGFTAIVLLAISHDFQRSFLRPLMHAGELRGCSEGMSDTACLEARMPTARLIPPDASAPALTARSDSLSRLGYNSHTQYQLWRRVGGFHRSRLLITLLQAINRVTAIDTLYDQSLRWLARIRTRFPDVPIYFIHLPGVNEVRAQQYERAVRTAIERLGITYFPALTECTWSPDLFYARDTHPNARGYDRIAACVEAYLFPEDVSGIVEEHLSAKDTLSPTRRLQPPPRP